MPKYKKMEDLNKQGTSDEIYKLLYDSVNNIFVLSKEIEWAKKESLTFSDNVNKIYSFSKDDFYKSLLCDYFAYEDIYGVPSMLIKTLSKIVLEFRVIGKVTVNMSDDKKNIIITNINCIINELEKEDIFLFSSKCKDLIFLELGFDDISALNASKDETLALLEVLMMRK